MADRNPSLLFIEALWAPLTFVPPLIAMRVFGGFEYYALVSLAQVLGTHANFCVNSICHESENSSKKEECFLLDNYLVGLFAAGEGFHSNHHKEAACARNAKKWYQPDSAYIAICALERCGLVWDVKHQSSKGKQSS
jgi:fatty-acid desaturase